MAAARAMLPHRLSGREIRFLRKPIGEKAVSLAKHLDVAPETLSRWENGHEAVGGRVALSVARCHLSQAARGRPDRLGGGDNRLIRKWRRRGASLAAQLGTLSRAGSNARGAATRKLSPISRPVVDDRMGGALRWRCASVLWPSPPEAPGWCDTRSAAERLLTGPTSGTLRGWCDGRICGIHHLTML